MCSSSLSLTPERFVPQRLCDASEIVLLSNLVQKLSAGGGVTKLATSANGVCQYGGVPSSPSIGIITGPASHSRVSNGAAAAAQASTTTVQAKLNAKTEGPKGVAASTVHGRGNIYAVGESLLIKRMLSSTDPEDVKNAGNDQYKKGNFSEALSLYDRAVSLAPNRASYRSNRAAALTGLGRLAEAVQECEESIKLDASYIRGHQRLVSLCIRSKQITSNLLTSMNLLDHHQHVNPSSTLYQRSEIGISALYWIFCRSIFCKADFMCFGHSAD